MQALSAEEFSVDYDLPDWRIIGGSIRTALRCSGFAEAATLISRIAAAADEADHHPDVDLRYPGQVLVSLTTHAARGLTDLDAHLAARISAVAAELGIRPDPSTVSAVEIAIDALDIQRIRPFWRAVLNMVDDGPGALKDPRRAAPAVWFQQMSTPRAQRSRIHIDVLVPHDQAEARVAAALAAGGTLLTDQYARSFWVLADAEGNEACVCTWQDRERDV